MAGVKEIALLLYRNVVDITDMLCPVITWRRERTSTILLFVFPNRFSFSVLIIGPCGYITPKKGMRSLEQKHESSPGLPNGLKELQPRAHEAEGPPKPRQKNSAHDDVKKYASKLVTTYPADIEESFVSKFLQFIALIREGDTVTSVAHMNGLLRAHGGLRNLAVHIP